MDEMDYISHNTSEPAAPQAHHTGTGSGPGARAGTGAAQDTAQAQTQSAPAPAPAPAPHSHPQLQFQSQNHTQQPQLPPQLPPQPSGCPYFRGPEQHHPHFQPPNHLPLPPQPHHPHFAPPPPQPIFNPHQSHSQSHSQSQPQIQHQGFLSNPQNRNPPSHYGVAQLHYDPVHATTANNWYPAVQWSPGGPALHHHSRTSSSDTYFGNLGGPPNLGPGPALNINPTGSASLHSLGLIHGQTSQHQLPHHEPFTGYFSRHHAPNGHRYPGIAPSVSSHSQNQGNNQSNTNTNQSSMSTMSSQSSSQQQQQHPSSQANPRPNILPTRLPVPPALPQPSQFTATMSGSGESTPDLPTNRRTMFGNDDSPRASNGNDAGAASETARNATRTPSATVFGGSESSTTESSSASRSDQPVLPTPPPPPNMDRRRPYTSRPPINIPDYDSDDEMDQLEDEHQALRFIEQFSMGANFPRDMGEAQVRAHQILRGQMPNKRVASKKALSQLQSVDMDSLEESERTCVICYNDFGVENPEGINEAPLRLPGCKHIFGDHCIKKWFEESDSCPYCRDKVPSEPIIPSGAQYIRDLYRQFPSRAHTGRGMTDLNIRIVPHRENESRYDSSPPRAWQTGDRRSPPSEASESRRRTRPRHSSFRTASNAATAGSSRHSSTHSGSPASIASLQQSPARERYPSQRYHNNHILSRFSMPPMSSMPPYQTPDSLGLTNPHQMPPMPPMPPHATAFGPMGNLDGSSSVSNPYPPPPVLGGPSGTTLSTGGDSLPGLAQLDAYSQQQSSSSSSLPPVVATDDAPFGAPTNPGTTSGVVRFTRPDGMVFMMQ